MKKQSTPRFVIFQKHVHIQWSSSRSEADWQKHLSNNRVAINPENVTKVISGHKSEAKEGSRTSSAEWCCICSNDGFHGYEVDGTFEEVLAALSR